jgi:hypothetical protein
LRIAGMNDDAIAEMQRSYRIRRRIERYAAVVRLVARENGS